MYLRADCFGAVGDSAQSYSCARRLVGWCSGGVVGYGQCALVGVVIGYVYAYVCSVAVLQQVHEVFLCDAVELASDRGCYAAYPGGCICYVGAGIGA